MKKLSILFATSCLYVAGLSSMYQKLEDKKEDSKKGFKINIEEVLDFSVYDKLEFSREAVEEKNKKFNKQVLRLETLLEEIDKKSSLGQTIGNLLISFKKFGNAATSMLKSNKSINSLQLQKISSEFDIQYGLILHSILTIQCSKQEKIGEAVLLIKNNLDALSETLSVCKKFDEFMKKSEERDNGNKDILDKVLKRVGFILKYLAKTNKESCVIL